MRPEIPVYEPALGEEEVAAVAAAVQRGEISGSFGETVTAFEREFAHYVGCQHGMAVNSGSSALQLAVAAAGIGQGDEVLLPASTYIATAAAVRHNGAVVVPVDSEPETWNMDLDLLEGLISERTRAVLPVHLFGHPVDMDRLLELANRRDWVVIEDCAESHGATVRGRMTGSFSAMSCFSFFANKVITTGEGGMVLTDNPTFATYVRRLRNQYSGTPRYLHGELGFSLRMTGLQAALGLAQLRKVGQTLEQKRRVAHTYNRLLAGVPGLRLPVEREWALNVYWMYGLVVQDEFPLHRDELMSHLARAGVETRTFFCPMNLQPALQHGSGMRAVGCPVAESLWKRGLYLPSSPSLTEEELGYIAARVGDAVGVQV
jgi:perosamine synthetase